MQLPPPPTSGRSRRRRSVVTAALAALLAAPLAFAPTAAAHPGHSGGEGGGPVVLDGMDPVCHAAAGENTDGYIAAVLASLWDGATRMNDGSIQVLGTAPTDSAGGCGGPMSGEMPSFLAGLDPSTPVTYAATAAEIDTFFAALAAGTVHPAIVWIPDNWSRPGDVDAAITAHALDIADFVNGGGALFANHGSYGWLTSLLPGAVYNDGGCNGGPEVTAAGVEAFPTLTDQLVEACWHGYFTGDTGTLVPLVDYPYPLPDSPRVAVSIGGGSVTLPSSFALELPTGAQRVGTTATLTATVKDGNLVPVAGQEVTFTIASGPHAGFTATATTDATGTASVTLSGTAVGTDVVTATAVLNGETKTVTGSVDWFRLPAAPTVTVAGGESSLVVSVAPAPGDTDLTAIEVLLQPGNVTTTLPGTGGQYTFVGLDNGSEYVIQAVARSASGDSPPTTSRGTPGRVVAPATDLSLQLVVQVGQSVAGAPVDVTGFGLRPLSEVRIELRSDPVLLGTATTDAAGAFTTRVFLPPMVAPGDHDIVAVGERPDGTPAIAADRVFVDWSGSLAAAVADGGYTGITPVRLLDTRSGAVPATGETVRLTVPAGLVPAATTSVALNVTATGAERAGYVTVFPCEATRPLASALNFTPGQDNANLVLSAVGAGDELCLYVSTDTHLVVDLNGYHHDASDDVLVATNPVRLRDTRTTSRLSAGETLEVPVVGAGLAPAEASSVALHVAVTEPSSAGFVTVFPCGATRPLASNLNHVAGETVGNDVLAGVGEDGTVCVYAMADTHVVVDMVGWFADEPTGGHFRPMVPGRFLDTRISREALQAGETVALVLVGEGALPDDTTAVSLNVAVDAPGTGGFLTVFPCGATRPLASNLNYAAGQTVGSHVTAEVGEDGSVCVYTSAAAHLVVDVGGSYHPAT